MSSQSPPPPPPPLPAPAAVAKQKGLRRYIPRRFDSPYYKEAFALPFGSGEALTDRERMLLCHLKNADRHDRASKVFNGRGEFYTKYTYLTTAFTREDLAHIGLERNMVPPTLRDRPNSRNEAQWEIDRREGVARGRALPPASGMFLLLSNSAHYKLFPVPEKE